jgi:hypothetical protein
MEGALTQGFPQWRTTRWAIFAFSLTGEGKDPRAGGWVLWSPTLAVRRGERQGWGPRPYALFAANEPKNSLDKAGAVIHGASGKDGAQLPAFSFAQIASIVIFDYDEYRK